MKVTTKMSRVTDQMERMFKSLNLPLPREKKAEFQEQLRKQSPKWIIIGNSRLQLERLTTILRKEYIIFVICLSLYCLLLRDSYYGS